MFRPLRSIVALGVALTTTVVLASTGAPAAAASSPPSVHVPSGTTLRVADQEDELQTSLQFAGQDTFPFNVQYSNFLGAPAVFEAFESGDVDLSFVGDSGIIQPQEAGQNFVVVGAYVDKNYDFGLIQPPGKQVSVIDKETLKGKKIGFEFGTNAQSYVLQLLEAKGLTPSEVDLVNIPATSYVAALKSGSVNFVVGESFLTDEYTAEVPGSKAIETPGIASGRIWIVADRDAVDNPAKSAAIAVYLEHVAATLRYINGHEAGYAQAYYVGAEKLPSSVAAASIKGIQPTYTVPIGSSIIQAQQEETNLFTQAGVIPQHLDVSKVFTSKYNAYVVGDEQS